MASDERLTKKERRERARRERKEQAAAEARRRRQRRFLSIATTVAAVGGIAALVLATRQPPAPTGITISPAAAEQAATAAGCAPVDIPQLAASPHLSEPAPPAEELYPVRPTDSGLHFGATLPVGTFDDPVDERVAVHNLEHGAVVVWYDPAKDVAVDAMEEWAEDRNRAGFQSQAGAGIILAPFPDGLSTGKAVAFRAWGVALDCEQWDQTVADAFLIANFGTHGQAPEAAFAPYPEEVLSFEDGGEQTTEAPGTPASPPATEPGPTAPATPTS